jgi:hypothetical protein
VLVLSGVVLAGGLGESVVVVLWGWACLCVCRLG